MSWSRALKETARSGLTIERTRLEPLVALRGACGVAIVVGVMLWLESPALAVSSAFGAFSSGVAMFQRSWRSRPVLALVAAGGLAVATFLGYLAAAHTAAFVVLLAVWTLLTGMAWAVGPVSGLVATQMVAVMLITVTLPTSVLGAAGHAGLIAVGGVVQALLAVVFPVRLWGARRDALADALAAVADYARRVRDDPTARFDPEPLMEARQAAAVTPRQARRRPRQLHGYRGLAEQIRPVLTSLADPVVGAPADGPERGRVRDLLAATGSVLDAVAHAVRHGTPVRLPPESMGVLEVPESGPVLHGAARRAALRLMALVQDVVESSDEPVRAVTAAGRPDDRYLPRPSAPGVAQLAWRSLWREARWSSPVLRHAVRLSVVSCCGYVIGAALPLGHGYWVPLASVMVMRPDFARTYSRGVARFSGTVLGVGVGGAVTALAHPGPYPSAALAVLCAGTLYLLMRTGYAVASACIGAYVVFLLSIAGTRWSQTVEARVALTLLGGLLAMAAYALFPAWETPRLRDRLATWLVTNTRYVIAVFEVLARPDQRHPRQVREALLDARAARADWELAVDRARREPVRHRGMSRRAAEAAEGALATAGRAAMLLEAHLPPPGVLDSPEADRFAAALRECLDPAAEAVRERRPLDWTPVHEALRAWEARVGEQQGVPVRAAELLVEALDELARALSRGAGGRRGNAGGRPGG